MFHLYQAVVIEPNFTDKMTSTHSNLFTFLLHIAHHSTPARPHVGNSTLRDFRMTTVTQGQRKSLQVSFKIKALQRKGEGKPFTVKGYAGRRVI